MKKIIVFIALLFIVAAGNQVQSEWIDGLSGEKLSPTGTRFRDVIRSLQEDYKDYTQVSQTLKEAGASYQKSLTADTADLSAYTTAGQQTTMSGLLAFDAGYSALFLQKKDALRFMEARRILTDKAGLAMPFSPSMKKLLTNPDAIRNFNTWSDAAEETMEAYITNQLGSDRDVKLLTDFFYGMVVEGLYITGESVSMAGYSPEMLTLMDRERERIAFMVKVLNLLRGDEDFENGVFFLDRMYFLSYAYSLLTVAEFTPQAVDRLRQTVQAEREMIVEAQGVPEMQALPAE